MCDTLLYAIYLWSYNSNFKISWTTLCWPTDHPSFKALTDFPRKLLIKVFAHHFALSYFHLNIIAIAAYPQRERIWFKEIKRKNMPSLKLAFIFIFFFNLRITINKRKIQHFIMIELGIVKVSLNLFWVQISKKHFMSFLK